jgi:PDZ domain/Carboxypeptidase regulatory-like domain
VIPADALPRVLRAIAFAALVVFGIGGIPGASRRAVLHDLAAPPVPSEVTGRDGALDVTVHDAAEGRALAGVHVRALALVEGRAYLADARDTAASGVAHLSGLPHGETWVLADAPGRARGSTRLVVEAGLRAVAIDLSPEHSLDVTVRDELGQPVPGADIEVTAVADPLPVGARTVSLGTARVGRLGAGPWRVTARAPGFEEGRGRASHDGETVGVVLRKLGAIAVHVVGTGGEAVADARVAVAGAMLWPARSAQTDASGNVRIGGLGAGIYALRATSGDRVSPIELGVLLERGQEKSLELRLAEGRWVAVRVTDGNDDDASPVAAARVTLVEQGVSPFPIEATTDARGRARLGPIAPGSATLGVRADGFVPRGAVLVADPPPPETRLVLVRAGVLTGRVVDARGYPIDGASVEIVGTDPAGSPIFDDPRRSSFQAAHFDAMLAGPAPLVPQGELGVMPGPVPPIPHQDTPAPRAEPLAMATPGGSLAEPWVTRADGTFRASPASPGRVRAIVRHPQYVEAQSDLVTLLPGGEAQVDVVMHEGGTLEGRVLDARDRPVEGARVVVSATHGTLERATRSAGDGTFAFAALPEEVSLTAGVDADDTQPDVRLSVHIPEQGKKDIVVRLPEPREALAVTVVDERDRPVDAAQVSASSLAADAPLRTTSFTDRRGEASLKRARGVPLRVEVSAPGRAPRIVTTDAATESLRVELAPSESASGEIVAWRGRDAVPGAEVTLYTDLGVRRTRTGTDGTFALNELAPGPARLDVRAPGFAPVTRTLTVPDSGGRRPFAIPRVELSAEGMVEGDVLGPRGEPVAGARVARDHVPTWLVVGATPPGIALTDARGRFSLNQLPEGTVMLEAYAPDIGRGRAEGVKVVSDRTTVNVHITLAADSGNDAASKGPAASGSVAVTLGESDEPVEVVIVSVVSGSEAERAGLAPGDVLTAVDSEDVRTMEEARARLSGPVADDVLVSLRRGNRALTLRVTREAVRR